LCSETAVAEPRDPVAADALFREARALLGQKKYAEACPKLAESFRLDPMAGTLYNLAECEEKQGKLASALLRWQAFIDLLTASKRLADPRFSVARKKIEELNGRVPRLNLWLREGIPPDTVVFRDGVELRSASLGVALPADPGEHRIVVRSPRRLDRLYTITIQEGESRTVELESGESDGSEPAPLASASASALPASSAEPPPGVPVPSAQGASPAGSWRRPTGMIVGGVGVAALIGAGVTGVILQGHKKTVEQDCDRSARLCSSSKGLDAAESGKNLAPVNLALWIVGALGTGAGAYLFLSAPREPSVQPGLSFSRELSGVWVQGRF
jgi:hypothetical protein